MTAVPNAIWEKSFKRFSQAMNYKSLTNMWFVGSAADELEQIIF